MLWDPPKAVVKVGRGKSHMGKKRHMVMVACRICCLGQWDGTRETTAKRCVECKPGSCVGVTSGFGSERAPSSGMAPEIREWEEDSLKSTKADANPWRSALTAGFKSGRARYSKMSIQIEEWEGENVNSVSADGQALWSGLAARFEAWESSFF